MRCIERNASAEPSMTPPGRPNAVRIAVSADPAHTGCEINQADQSDAGRVGGLLSGRQDAGARAGMRVANVGQHRAE